MILFPLKENAPTSPSVPAGRLPYAGAQGFGGVFEHRHTIAAAEREDGIHVGALTIEVHHDDGAGQSVSLGSLAESVFQDVRIQVPGGVVAIEKNRLGAEIANWIAACGEGESRAKDFVARAHAEKTQAEVDGGGAAGESDHGQADAVGKLPFEGGQVRPRRGQPVGRERLPDIGLFSSAHVGDGE